MNIKNGHTILRFNELQSTNDYAKEKRADGKNLYVIAKKQTGGRGTKGRSFSSNAGGFYFTALTFYDGFLAKNAFKIMQNTAVAVCETLSSFGLSPKIKWPNDVYVNGKKICGILIENALCGENISSSVVGVGVNVCNDLPQELENIATTISKELGKSVSVSAVEKRFLRFLADEKLHEKYESYLGWIGEKVTLIIGEESVPATLLSVTNEGRITVQTEKGVQTFASLEVRLKTNAE